MMAILPKAKKSSVKHSKATTTKAQDLAKQRRVELEKYFSGLEALEDFTSGKTNQLSSRIFEGDFMKIAKASSFLLLYNYIEGCVLQAFTEIYDDIKNNEVPYSDLRTEFQKIWVAHKTKPLLTNPDASHNSYNEIAASIIENIIKNKCIELDRKALPISGNLNEKKIKSVCEAHGIKLPSKATSVIDGMEVVMSTRNDLAHGSISFGECGRGYTVSDLNRIRATALSYIELFLSGIETFAAGKRYKEKAVQK
jgi:hypothetical protein